VALLLLVVALLAAVGGSAQAAPAVDTWVQPSPPRVDPFGPFFHDDARHQLVIVEWRNNPARLWTLPDQGARAWSAVDIAGGGPRDAFSRSAWAYDAAGDRVFLVSPRSDSGPCCSDTTTTFRSLEAWQVTLGDSPHWTQIVTTGDRPIWLQEHLTAFDPKRQRLLVLGGRMNFSEDQFNEQVFALELGASPHWLALEPPGPALHRRAGNALVDPVTDRLFVLGGSDSLDHTRELWSLPLDASGPWQKVTPPDTLPVMYESRMSALDPAGRRILLYASYRRELQADTMAVFEASLDGTSGWRMLPATAGRPRARAGASMAWDATRGRIALYAGSAWPSEGYDGQRFDLFEFAGGRWWPVQVSGDTRRMGSGVGVAFDRAQHRAIVIPPDASYNDIDPLVVRLGADYQDWERSRPEYPSQRPPARAFAAVAFDSVGDRTLVFGGRDGLAELGDLWEISLLSTGTPVFRRIVTAGPAPSPRWGAATVFDPVRRRLVLFGGWNGEPLADAWALSLAGTPRWTQIVSSSPAPPARFGGSAVYDSRRDGLVLYGGNAGTDLQPVTLGDTWFLSFVDGDRWLPLTAAGSAPIGRWLHAAVYDPPRDRMIVLWGRDRSGARFDCGALELSGTPTWREYTPAGPGAEVRYGHAAFYDPDLDRATIVGGESSELTDWYLDFAPATGGNPGAGPPLALLGMTPNPTKAGVDVAFDLPAPTAVRVRLYDARGRLVRDLGSRGYPAGRHLVHWDGAAEGGARPRPGVYFARLELGVHEYSGKVVLLR
jgi:hypothetical protein